MKTIEITLAAAFWALVQGLMVIKLFPQLNLVLVLVGLFTAWQITFRVIASNKK